MYVAAVVACVQCDQMLEWKVAQFAQNLPQKLAKVVFN